MPIDRFFHPRAGHSRKVTLLNDLAFRVWWTYQIAADDYGVMLRSPVVLQAANDSLAKRSKRVVTQALDRVVDVGLLVSFEHQEDWFVCQLDWQDFQKVRYPRESFNPRPPPEILQKCSRDTSELFQKHSGKISEIDPQHSGKSSEIDPQLPRAGAREEANGLRLTANGLRPTANGGARLRGGGAAAGMNPVDHLKHAVCDETFSRCVPNAVHFKLCDLLAPRYTGDRHASGDALKAWYLTVWASLPDDFVIGEAFKFWQGRFDAAFASHDATKPGPFYNAASDDTVWAQIAKQGPGR